LASVVPRISRQVRPGFDGVALCQYAAVQRNQAADVDHMKLLILSLTILMGGLFFPLVVGLIALGVVKAGGGGIFIFLIYTFGPFYMVLLPVLAVVNWVLAFAAALGLVRHFRVGSHAANLHVGRRWMKCGAVLFVISMILQWVNLGWKPLPALVAIVSHLLTLFGVIVALRVELPRLIRPTISEQLPANR